MNNTSTDNFEAIAKDAVAALTAAALTLKLIGERELASAIADSARDCIDRAIALGGV
jgi:hypothetical protein